MKTAIEAIENLIHLHGCEQEGMVSGQPTPKQWIEAVQAAHEAIQELKAAPSPILLTDEAIDNEATEYLYFLKSNLVGIERAYDSPKYDYLKGMQRYREILQAQAAGNSLLYKLDESGLHIAKNKKTDERKTMMETEIITSHDDLVKFVKDGSIFQFCVAFALNKGYKNVFKEKKEVKFTVGDYDVCFDPEHMNFKLVHRVYFLRIIQASFQQTYFTGYEFKDAMNDLLAELEKEK